MAYYFLDSQRLKTGDVILETSDGKISALIKAGDRIREIDERVPARFSHAFIYVGMGYIMEADKGVRSILAARIITDKLERFLVLRHPEHQNGINVDWLGEFASISVFAAIHPEVNKEYNWRGVFGTKLPFVGSTEGTFFCSQLVGEAYRRLKIDLFDNNRLPKMVTPNSLLSRQCKLQPIDTESCFSQLPDAEWVSALAKQNRYKVIEHEPIPLMQIGHDVSKKMVKTFASRINSATASIGKKQTIASSQDIMITLYLPDLPDGDAISDDIVKFMKLNYPTDQIRQYRKMHMVAGEEFFKTGRLGLISMMTSTLTRDIEYIPQMLSIIKSQIEWMTNIPSVYTRRSFHKWQLSTLHDTFTEETEFLEWRRVFLAKIVRSNMSSPR